MISFDVNFAVIIPSISLSIDLHIELMLTFFILFSELSLHGIIINVLCTIIYIFVVGEKTCIF